ncbi:methyltransferase domain-containing protein [Cryptosporangium aurantiacum]|uniref:Trans-aconitate 2-methyltransferase n=1 Tax=Cryptosporangium aurantiacum TaxID=134849 RepID=A0A1M7RIL7_9ACTN|nr:methyltransferase domain-containing protein [Cryptosporangium aurantiacum]SHN45992.1 trans-aconitate 2-methyltransferase [Cryptosporangium aurantiacum]
MRFEQWDPAVYIRRRPERARPFVELVARIGAAPDDVRSVVDAGCGPGYLTATLAERYPEAQVVGFDSSAAMITEAQPLARAGLRFALADVSEWTPTPDVDVLVSNAVLHWIEDHPALLRRWADALAPGAWLAVQVPGNQHAPSHAAVRELIEAPSWRNRLAGTSESGPVLEPVGYAALLSDAGFRVDAWETTYLHELPDDAPGRHPVLGWLEGTTLRPVIAALSPDEYAEFTADLTARLTAAYPVADGRVWYPFRRLFVVAQKGTP